MTPWCIVEEPCPAQQRGKRGGLKPIGERCNLSPLTSAEGVYSAAGQITRTSHSIALSGWLVFRPLNPVQLNLLLLLRRECYSSFVTGCSVIWRFSLRLSLSLKLLSALSLYSVSFFLCGEPVILPQRDDSLLYLSRPSFPHFLLLFFSPRVPCPITLCPPLLYVFMSLSSQPPAPPFSDSRHSVCSLVSLLFILCAKSFFSPFMSQGAGTLTGDMEVHLPRHEQPGGTNRNHQLHKMPVVSWEGFKTTAKRDYLFP